MAVSLKTCIDEMCKKCSYEQDAPGTWRQQIEGCCGRSCELYNVRPLTTASQHEVKLSRRKAIDQQCKACVYDPNVSGQGSWRNQVKNCGNTDCPLYEVRPVPTTSNLIEVEEVE